MLDERCALSGYNRSYAARLLREKARGRPSRRKRRRGRGPVYGPELLAPLTKVWATLGGICGKRVAAVMGRTVAALERHGELALTDEAREKLLTMSAATIDRLLATRRRRRRLGASRRSMVAADMVSSFSRASSVSWCSEQRLTFTRSRAYEKNDSCYVEQNNWSVVRRETGYGRYDTEVERELIAVIYADLRLYVNFFLPSVKLLAKQRTGAKVYKRYDKALTPHQRLLALKALDEATAARLEAQYLTLNPAALRRRLTDNEKKLARMCSLKMQTRRKEVAATG